VNIPIHPPNMSAATVNPIFNRIYSLRDLDDCKAVYDEWATSYDNDVNDPASDYVGPARAAQSAATHGNINGTVLDAGCGTGLCGIALAHLGAKTIDGLDLSPGMLKVADKTGAYRHLGTADLSKPIEKPDAAYDVVTCVGTLTKTHVGPDPALKEFARIIKRGGVVVATVLEDIWAPGGFEAEVERLAKEGVIDVVSTEKGDYRHDLQARILVFRRK
jgi:predicted TPR repeat methyltransferase